MTATAATWEMLKSRISSSNCCSIRIWTAVFLTCSSSSKFSICKYRSMNWSGPMKLKSKPNCKRIYCSHLISISFSIYTPFNSSIANTMFWKSGFFGCSNLAAISKQVQQNTFIYFISNFTLFVVVWNIYRSKMALAINMVSTLYSLNVYSSMINWIPIARWLFVTTDFLDAT